MELHKRGYQVTVGKSGEQEVDFIGTWQKETLYIQISYLLASDDTISQGFGIYDLTRDNYPKYVVSIDEFDFGRNGINFPPTDCGTSCTSSDSPLKIWSVESPDHRKRKTASEKSIEKSVTQNDRPDLTVRINQSA